MNRIIKKSKVITIAAVFSFISLLDATAASMKDAIIVYAGVGNLGQDAQPCLAMMYETGGKKFLPYTDKINDEVCNALSSVTLFEEKKTVIVEADQLNAAIKKDGAKFEGRPSQMQIKEFLENNEGNVFALSVIGGSELYTNYIEDVAARRSKDDGGGVGKTNFDFLVAGVSVLLTQISGDNAGQVILAGTAIREANSKHKGGYLGQGKVGCENSDTISDKWLDIVATTYASAAVAAINVLSNLNDTAEEDATSVIVTGVSVNSQVVKNLFRTIITDDNSVKSICDIPLPCLDGDKQCKGLIGMLAFGLTETLSKKGFMAVPPLNWGAWGKSSQYQVTKNLKMTGGRSDVLPFVQMNVGSNSADRKIHSTVTKFVEKDLPVKKKKYLGHRHYVGWISHRWEETEYDNCKVVDEKGSYPGTKAHVKMRRTQKELGTDPPMGQRLTLTAVTLMKAIWDLENKIELD